MLFVTGTSILDSTESPERTLHFKKEKWYRWAKKKPILLFGKTQRLKGF